MMCADLDRSCARYSSNAVRGSPSMLCAGLRPRNRRDRKVSHPLPSNSSFQIAPRGRWNAGSGRPWVAGFGGVRDPRRARKRRPAPSNQAAPRVEIERPAPRRDRTPRPAPLLCAGLDQCCARVSDPALGATVRSPTPPFRFQLSDCTKGPLECRKWETMGRRFRRGQRPAPSKKAAPRAEQLSGAPHQHSYIPSFLSSFLSSFLHHQAFVDQMS